MIEELATLASIAARIDRVVLRRLRLELLPAADATVEADLWFSPLVARRTVSAIVLRDDRLEELRARLVESGRLEATYGVVDDAHRGAPPLLQLEEELVFMGLAGAAPARIEARLAAALLTLREQPARAFDISSWALRALPRLPRAVRDTTAAWSLAVAASFRTGYSVALGDVVPAGTIAIDERIPDVDLQIARTWTSIQLGGPGDATIRVPATAPRIVSIEVGTERRTVAVEPGGFADVPVPEGEVVLSNLRGERWRVQLGEVTVVRQASDAEVENGRWVLVDGPERPDPRAQALARELGRGLALAGFSLLTLGRPGSPELVARSFWEQLERQDYTSGIYRMMHLVGSGEAAAYEARGRTLRLSERESAPAAATMRASLVLAIGPSRFSGSIADAAPISGIPAWWLVDEVRGFEAAPLRVPEPWNPESLHDYVAMLGGRLLAELDVELADHEDRDRLVLEAAARALDLPSPSQFEARLETLRARVSPRLAVHVQDPWRPAYRLVGYLAAGRIPCDAMVRALRAELTTVRATWMARTLRVALEAVRGSLVAARTEQDRRDVAAICHVLERELGQGPRVAFAGDCGKLLSELNSGGPANERAVALLIQARTYEQLREQQATGSERTARLDDLVDEIAARWSEPGCSREAELWFDADEPGLRIVALALLFRAKPRGQLPEIIDRSLLGPYSAFEQYTALRAAAACLAGPTQWRPDPERLDRFEVILRRLLDELPTGSRSSLIEEILGQLAHGFDVQVAAGRVCRIEPLGQDRILCTGFLVASDLVATVRHGVEDLLAGRASDVRLRFPEGTASVDIANHLVRAIGDLALIRISPPIGERAGWFKLSSEWAEPVTLVCHAERAARPMMMRARLIERSEGEFEYRLAPPATPGSSGGPLVDAAGRVVAIHTHRRRYRSDGVRSLTDQSVAVRGDEDSFTGAASTALADLLRLATAAASAPPQQQAAAPSPSLAARRKRERQLQLANAHNRAIVDHLQEIGIAIIGLKQGEPDSIGSGTCVQIGDRYLVATSARVIEPYRDGELLLVTQQERQDWTPPIAGRGVDPRLDLAWLELAPDVARELHRRFVPIDRLQPHRPHLPDDLVIVCGFPRRLARIFREERGIGVQPLCISSQTLEDAERPTDADPERDIYVEFPEHDLVGPGGGPASAVAASGLIGAGIWSAEVNHSGIWTPELCQLIGIEHAWAVDKYIHGTQIQHWLALVARDLPDVGAEVEHVIR